MTKTERNNGVQHKASPQTDHPLRTDAGQEDTNKGGSFLKEGKSLQNDFINVQCVFMILNVNEELSFQRSNTAAHDWTTGNNGERTETFTRFILLE